MSLFVSDPVFTSNHLTLFAGMGFVGGLYLFFCGFRLLARKRLLINTPISKIRSAALGLVEVSGTAVGPYILHTPVAGIPCFLYRTTAWQKSDEGRNREWKKVAEETLHVPFYLDDGTGQLLIQPQGAELDLHRDWRQDYGDTIFGEHAGEEVLNFLVRHGVAAGNDIRIEEYAIRPQSRLFVAGTLAENPGVEVAPAELTCSRDETGGRVNLSAGIEVPQAEIVRLSEPAVADASVASTQQSRIAAALLKAGITKPSAWEAAGVRPSEAPKTKAPRVSHIFVNGGNPTEGSEPAVRFNLRPPVVLMKGENDRSFLISWRSQRALVRTLAWKSSAMIWLGAGLALLGIYVFAAQMQLM